MLESKRNLNLVNFTNDDSYCLYFPSTCILPCHCRHLVSHFQNHWKLLFFLKLLWGCHLAIVKEKSLPLLMDIIRSFNYLKFTCMKIYWFNKYCLSTDLLLGSSWISRDKRVNTKNGLCMWTLLFWGETKRKQNISKMYFILLNNKAGKENGVL